MSLHFVLQVNYQSIGDFYAQRVRGDDQEDTVNLYKVAIDGDAFVVEHRYGDGAWTLVRKCIQAWEELQDDFAKHRSERITRPSVPIEARAAVIKAAAITPGNEGTP